MKKLIIAILISASIHSQGNVDVDLGSIPDLTWQGSGTVWYSVFGGGAVASPFYTNSLHDVDLGMWNSTRLEFTYDPLAFTNSTFTNSSDYVGTSTLISNVCTYQNEIYTNGSLRFTNQYSEYDGVDDYSATEWKDAYYNSNNFTIMGWVRPETNSGGTLQYFLSTANSATRAIEFGFSQTYNDATITNSSLICVCSPCNIYGEVGTIPPFETWTHVALTFATGAVSSVGKIYTNGVEIAYKGRTYSGRPQINRFMFGNRSNLSGDYKGAVDAWSFIDGTFTQAQIQSNYNATAYRYRGFPLLGTNSLYDVDQSMWQQSKAEFLFEKPNMLSFTNSDYTNSTDYVGTSTLITNLYTYVETSSNGYLNGCAYFDGVNDYACEAEKADGYYNTNNWTVQGWVKSYSNDTRTTFLSAYTNTTIAGSFGLNMGVNYSVRSASITNKSLWVQFGTAMACSTSEGTLPETNTWFHVAVVQDPSVSTNKTKVFINGTEQTYFYNASLTGVRINRMMFGVTTSLGSDYQGYLDGWSFANTNFTPSQIQSNYNATKYRFGL